MRDDPKKPLLIFALCALAAPASAGDWPGQGRLRGLRLAVRDAQEVGRSQASPADAGVDDALQGIVVLNSAGSVSRYKNEPLGMKESYPAEAEDQDVFFEVRFDRGIGICDLADKEKLNECIQGYFARGWRVAIKDSLTGPTLLMKEPYPYTMHLHRYLSRIDHKPYFLIETYLEPDRLSHMASVPAGKLEELGFLMAAAPDALRYQMLPPALKKYLLDFALRTAGPPPQHEWPRKN